MRREIERYRHTLLCLSGKDDVFEIDAVISDFEMCEQRGGTGRRARRIS